MAVETLQYKIQIIEVKSPQSVPKENAVYIVGL